MIILHYGIIKYIRNKYPIQLVISPRLWNYNKKSEHLQNIFSDIQAIKFTTVNQNIYPLIWGRIINLAAKNERLVFLPKIVITFLVTFNCF